MQQTALLELNMLQRRVGSDHGREGFPSALRATLNVRCSVSCNHHSSSVGTGGRSVTHIVVCYLGSARLHMKLMLGGRT
jgi:hypothetical protein